MAQLVKNEPAMRETWVRSLGWEDPLEKGEATHSSILAWRIPWTVQSMGSQSQTRLRDFHFTFIYLLVALLGLCCCMGHSLVVAHGLDCPSACGIFLDQGWNPCPLPWQADSLPLSYQGSPLAVIWSVLMWQILCGKPALIPFYIFQIAYKRPEVLLSSENTYD